MAARPEGVMYEMAYWLFKSEPSTWSWEDQKKKGAKGEPWNGVRNYQANNNMKAMKKGDLGFFYHSVDEKRMVGIVRVIGEHRPDPRMKRAVSALSISKPSATCRCRFRFRM
jgi:predicted RNA-binding protein with PUA-like domain